MAKIKLENHTGQILKGMKVSCPAGGYYWKDDEPIKAASRIVFECTGNNRLGIGRYKINLKYNGESYHSFNYAMDDDDKQYHSIWRLESAPLTPKDIYELYGYKVGDNGERLVSYKITGRKRAMKLMKYYKEICDLEKYKEIEAEWNDCKNKNKVFKNPLYFKIFYKSR
jgi:hypothetical protein